jgi:putative DNA primase/helicase
MPGEVLSATVHRFLVGAKKLAPPAEGAPVALVPFNPNKWATDEAIHALRSLCLLDRHEAPAWIGTAPPAGYDGLRAGDLVALRNGLFHLPRRQLLPHTPQRFGLTALPYAYDPAATCAEWLKFVRSVWPDDPQSIEALQEMIGYLVSGDTRMQKVFFIVGPRRSGKGTVCRVIMGLLGQENVVGPTLQSLAGQFGMASLVGKTAAIIGDARSGGKDVQTTVERLLGISGGDVQSVDRKNRDAWEGRLGVRFVICSNEVPKLPDASGALVGRMQVLRMEHSFFGKEDPDLAGRLLQELPGILNWALEGLRRLEERGRFVQPASSTEVIEQMEALGSHVGEFLKDCCVLVPRERMSKQRLYDAYRLWAKGQGISHPDQQNVFAQKLGAAETIISTVRPNEGPRKRVWEGIRLVDEWAERADMASIQ